MIKLIPVLLVLVLTSCKKESPNLTPDADVEFKPTGNMSDLVYNPMRPDGTLDSSYLPVLTWKEVEYDFGSAFEGDIVSKDFFFTNTGTAPLLILNASSTCGCTIPEWPKKPVPPDSTASIRVKFNTLHKPGAQSKEVTIFANTFPNTSKILLKGQVNSTN
ncbi:MAG: DUF1573 domain-containing protein [Saprospiraceae bacterium]|nr:DUF1573 domain-containing protein [Candidatus Opimibacter iunctus]